MTANTPKMNYAISRDRKQDTISVIAIDEYGNREVIETWHESAAAEAYALFWHKSKKDKTK